MNNLLPFQIAALIVAIKYIYFRYDLYETKKRTFYNGFREGATLTEFAGAKLASLDTTADGCIQGKYVQFIVNEQMVQR